MILFRGKEIDQRQKLHGQLRAGLFFLGPIDSFDFRQLVLFGIIDARAILDAPVVPLPVDRERINHHEVITKQVGQADPVLVIDNFNRLRMAAAGAYLLIAGRGIRTVGIAHLCADHAVKLVEKLLHAPEAASGKVNRFFAIVLILPPDVCNHMSVIPEHHFLCRFLIDLCVRAFCHTSAFLSCTLGCAS